MEKITRRRFVKAAGSTIAGITLATTVSAADAACGFCLGGRDWECTGSNGLRHVYQGVWSSKRCTLTGCSCYNFCYWQYLRTEWFVYCP